MKTNFKNGNTYIVSDGLFDLEKTFSCGQCFRFEKCEKGFTGIAYGKRMMVYEENGYIVLAGVDETEYNTIWKDFFDLQRDYSKINEVLSHDTTVENAIKLARGIRILRQEKWETLCSFIISQNNNIPRIKGIINRFCELLGEKTDGDYSFPTAEKTFAAGVEALAPIRAGFRARYIIDAAQKVLSKEVDLDQIEKMSYIDAKQTLMKIKGVGSKVSDCVLLFGYGFFDAFPKDVWIKRVIEKYYGDTFDESIFAPYGGIAQQYLFYYEREVSKQSKTS